MQQVKNVKKWTDAHGVEYRERDYSTYRITEIKTPSGKWVNINDDNVVKKVMKGSYTEGKVKKCKKCDEVVTVAKSSLCREHYNEYHREAQKTFRAENPGKYTEKKKVWHRHKLETDEEYNERIKTKKKAYNKEYSDKNKEKIKNYRASKRDELNKKQREHYNKNRDAINDKRREKAEQSRLENIGKNQNMKYIERSKIDEIRCEFCENIRVKRNTMGRFDYCPKYGFNEVDELFGYCSGFAKKE